jgi:hypothetical protein
VKPHLFRQLKHPDQVLVGNLQFLRIQEPDHLGEEIRILPLEDQRDLIPQKEGHHRLKQGKIKCLFFGGVAIDAEQVLEELALDRQDESRYMKLLVVRLCFGTLASVPWDCRSAVCENVSRLLGVRTSRE